MKIQSFNFDYSEIPRFFRIGTVPTTPWAYYKLDSRGMVMKDKEGRPKLQGYCIEMIEEMANRMKFDYEIILPTDNSEDYGGKQADGSWSGVIGDLVKGEIDIAVAGMTMTSEREEVVDFVAPYFDQSGISIIIREPVRPRSLFKFMEVLRVEVWLAILAALVVTALMLWFLDRFSPYSARNNKEAHPYPCRVFTLKESFWFALTSFTPQGGGEAPKSLSGRVLVAAYWLFVVLMLATFTANLAAFLTVERMQTTVAGLEELAQQSKINYTVVEGSPYYEYFKNMASAEEDLYKKWKDMTLSSNADQSRYRVWDYPIKEQYTHIFKTIKASGMVTSASQGFQKVLEDEKATFAFIHDASQVHHNCILRMKVQGFMTIYFFFTLVRSAMNITTTATLRRLASRSLSNPTPLLSNRAVTCKKKLARSFWSCKRIGTLKCFPPSTGIQPCVASAQHWTIPKVSLCAPWAGSSLPPWSVWPSPWSSWPLRFISTKRTPRTMCRTYLITLLPLLD